MNEMSRISRRSFGAGALGAAGLALLAACGQGAQAGASGASSGAGGGGGGGTGTYANKGMDFFFFVMLAESIKRRTEELGFTYNSTDAKQDSSQQFNQAKTLLVQKPSFLVVDTVDSGAWAPIATQTKGAKVPFGAVDSLVTDGEIDFQVAFDNSMAGTLAAQKTVELLKAKYGTERGQVFNGYGALSSAAWNARKIAFEAELAKYPEIQLISRPTDGSETTARQVAGATLSEFADLDAIHGPSDSITRGFITAMQTADRLKKVGEEGHIIVTTIDGEPQALQWFRDGTVDAPVSQDPVAYGEICVDMLTTYTAKGQAIPLGAYDNKDYFWESSVIDSTPNGPVMTIPPYIIDKDNVEDPRQWANVVTQKWGIKQ
ncbi:sugar ABC transporter substrate-binding protein [Nakamurella flavida]|uniref:Sugar ABC transporter substrate-binding protein n=2 Tax=Nakamurella flavida TaxID=363630 RepID=A0A938YMW5_9ACTN|nr:sugar ABC transporter substrate-binding protein [Nakamurella flavida]MDP9778584.1 ABC-type sugar transport system substrate-binding protein [Nakamurella flavida]